MEGARSIDGANLDGLLVGARVRLEHCVGQGSMGWVYRATHLSLGSSVAVKIMKPSGSEETTRAARFEQEARAASRLAHPHVITIHDFGRTPGGLFYIVSEFIEGRSLGDLLADGPLPIGRAANIFHQILAAVEEAHHHQLIHRDLKPDNVMLTPLRSGEDFVKVLDFGIARMLDSPGTRITLGGELCGTPAYLAPELIRGQAADARSDLYALGIILYQMVTGRHPFETEVVLEMLSQQLHGEVPDPRRFATGPEVTAPLAQAILRALAKDPDARFQSVSGLRDAVATALAEVDAWGTVCDSCDSHRTEWSGRCAGCGFGRIAPAPAPTRSSPLDGLSAPWAHPTPRRERSASGTRPPAGRAASPVLARQGSIGSVQPMAPRSHLSTPSPDGGDLRPSSRETVADGGRLLFGREEELARIERWLDGHGAALEVIAQAGMGKSAVLGVAAGLARSRGLRALEIVASPAGAQGPARLARALVSALAAPGDVGVLSQAEQAGLSPTEAAALAPLLEPADALAARDHPHLRAREALAAALQWVGLVGAQAPLLIVVDGLSDFDAESIRWARRLLGAARDGGPRLLVASAAALWSDEPGVQSLRLGPMDPEALSALVARASHGGLSASATRAVLDQARGGPLAAEIRAASAADGVPLEAPTLSDVLWEWLERLTGPQRILLEAVALSEPAPEPLVRKAAALGAEFDEALQCLLDRRLVTRGARPVGSSVRSRSGGRPPWLTTGHEIIAEVVRANVRGDRAKDLHRRLHDALADQEAPADQRAAHAVGAGLGEIGLERLSEAARAASAWQDHDGASAHLRQAAQVARFQLLMDPGDRTLLELGLRLGSALRAGGHLLSAELVLKEAAVAADAHPGLALALQRELARLFRLRGRLSLATEHARSASLLAQELGRPEQLLAALELAASLTEAGDLAAAATELESTLLVAAAETDTGDAAPQDNLWRALLRLASLRDRLGDGPGARSALEQAHLAAVRARAVEGVARVQLSRAARSDLAPPEAQAALRAAREQFERIGDRQGLAECLLVEARRFPDGSRATLRRALALSRLLAWGEGEAQAQRLLSAAGPRG